MSKQSAEDYLDKLLNSVNGEEEIETEEDVLLDFFGAENVVSSEDVVDEPTELGEDIDLSELFGDTGSQPEEKKKNSSLSKSEEDFLAEFEAELENDDFSDLMKRFDEDTATLPEERLNLDDISLETVGNLFAKEEETPAITQEDSFSLGGIDLGDLLGESSDDVVTEESGEVNVFDVFAEEPVMETFPTEELPTEEFPIEEFKTEELALEELPVEKPATDAKSSADDLFGGDLSDLFGGDLFGGETATATDAPAEAPVDDMFASLFGDSEGGGTSGDVIDLGNMGEADLLSLLSGEDFGDIGDMLTQNDSGNASAETLDAFAAFAEGEMLTQANDVAVNTKNKKSPFKEGGLLDKLSTILFGLDDEEDEVNLKATKAPTAGALADENNAILASMELEDKGKKKKEKKPKKEKAPKPKKEKKAKKPKEPKPKKEKKPVEIDNTPPLKKGPVILIVLMVASLFALVILGTNLIGYAITISTAKSYFHNAQYKDAYVTLFGVELNEDDMELYNQAAVLAPADSELRAYEIFYANNRQEEAIDSLICAAGRCKINADEAALYGCEGQLEILRKEIANELKEKYGMTYEEAIEFYSIKDRDDYTIALKVKIRELGLEVE